MHRDWRVVMIEGGLETERANRWSKSPAQMRQPFDEMRRQPKVIGAHLPVVLALAQSRIGERLAIGVYQLVFLKFIVELERIQQDMWMLQPERMIRDRFDLVCCLQYPTFTPAVDDPVFRRCLGDKSQRHFQDDAIDVFACLTIDPAVDKAIVAVLVFAEFVPVPG